MKSHAPDSVGLAPVPCNSPSRNGGGRILCIQRAAVDIDGKLYRYIRKSHARDG